MHLDNYTPCTRERWNLRDVCMPYRRTVGQRNRLSNAHILTGQKAGKEIIMKKSTLSANVPVRSDIHDIAPEKTLGFTVEFEDACLPAPEVKYDLPIGMRKVRAMQYAKRAFEVKRNRYGDEYVEDEHYEIVVEDIETGDRTIVKVPATEKAVSSFKRGLNKRTGGDIASKFGEDWQRASLKSFCQYWHRFPIEILFDFSEWVDKDSNELKRSKYPKVQVWIPQDFQKPEAKNWIDL